MSGPLQIVAFGVFAFISIAGALGMATTMSMFRSGIFLMASFVGVAGLFVLLSADLIGLLQVMMYLGGMLVMILFMVLFMHDPGGSVMAAMQGLAPPERWFSRGLVPRGSHRPEPMEMSMVTPARPVAAWLATLVGIGLTALLLLRPAWHHLAVAPDPDSARRIGHLLMQKYMIAFEGAGTLILIGIFGAVYLARPSTHPDDPSRDARVAVDEMPPAIADEALPPPAGRGNGPGRGVK